MRRMAFTDANGQYAVGGLPSGSAEVSAAFRAVEFSDSDETPMRQQHIPTQLEKGRTVNVDFDFSVVGAEIEGTVMVQGQPASGVDVELDCGEEYFFIRRQNGATYRFTKVPSGEWNLRVSNAQPASRDEYYHSTHPKTIQVETGRTYRVDFALPDE